MFWLLILRRGRREFNAQREKYRPTVVCTTRRVAKPSGSTGFAMIMVRERRGAERPTTGKFCRFNPVTACASGFRAKPLTRRRGVVCSDYAPCKRALVCVRYMNARIPAMPWAPA